MASDRPNELRTKSGSLTRIPVQFIANSSTNCFSDCDVVPSSSHPPHYPHPPRPAIVSSRRDNDVNGYRYATSTPPPLARNMDDSVEKVFREWDSGLRSRTETTMAVRPLSVVCRPERSRRTRQQMRPASKASDGSLTMRVDRRTPSEDDVLRNNRLPVVAGNCYSSGDDSFDDASSVVSQTRSTSTRSPAGDQSSPRTFRVEFDVDGYQLDDISVQITGDQRLVVRGVRRETDAGRTSTTEFCRKIRLPDDVDAARLACYLRSDGRVVVEAPRQAPTTAVKDSNGGRVAPVESLNMPTVTGGQLSLVVEVGRLFRADDVVVKVKNSALTLSVAAVRNDESGGSGDQGRRWLNASVAWEFDMPAAVDVQTLKAGLTVDGLLRISARLSPDTSSDAVSTTNGQKLN